MKRLYIFLMMLMAALFFVSSCDLIDELKDKDINPDETVAKEGNTWSATATGYPEASIVVDQNTKGVATFKLNYNNQEYAVTGRISKTKIEDFVYSGGDASKAFTLVDFDAKVGDKWEYNVGTEKVTREVTYKSTTDDYYAMGLLIKVIQVEETIPEGLTIMGYPAQAKKILWTFNHKFGWVGAVVTKTDNTEVPVYLSYTNAGSGK
jgi:hypothetical protein